MSGILLWVQTSSPARTQWVVCAGMVSEDDVSPCRRMSDVFVLLLLKPIRSCYPITQITRSFLERMQDQGDHIACDDTLLLCLFLPQTPVFLLPNPQAPIILQCACTHLVLVWVAALPEPQPQELLVDVLWLLAGSQPRLIAVSQPVPAAVWGVDLGGHTRQGTIRGRAGAN